MDRPRLTELDLKLTPGEALERVAPGADHCVFLDSAQADGRLGRFSILAWAPETVLKTRGRRVWRRRGGVWSESEGGPFEALRETLAEGPRLEAVAGVPFAGGGIGYLSYDLCHFVERLPRTGVDDLAMPDLYVCFFDRALVYDHARRRWVLAEAAGPGAAGEVTEALGGEAVEPDIALPPGERAVLGCNFSREDYVRTIARGIEYIAAGDIFQVNLSQRFSAPWPHDPLLLYRRLRTLNPAPFAAWLGLDGVHVASSSPERFLEVSGPRVETRPIKGTRPRGATVEADRLLAEELLASEKDRAELAMIVDLERNDIGRVCRYGSVRVTEKMVLEAYPTVWHLVSTVVGELAGGRDRVDLLRATFPGGSITGAPKVRAMEIIDELEPTRRGVYTGAIGYMGYDGRMDLNIAIRTAVLQGGTAYYQAGGGIVADSDPELEFEETLHKARAFRWVTGAEAATLGAG